MQHSKSSILFCPINPGPETEGRNCPLVLCSDETPVGVMHPAPGSPTKEGSVETGTEKGQENDWGLELLSCDKRLLSLEKRRFQAGRLYWKPFNILRGLKEKQRLFTRTCSDMSRGNGFKWNRIDLDKTWRIYFFDCKDCKTLEQFGQRSCGCPSSGTVWSEVRWGFEKPGPVGDVPIHVRDCTRYL